MRIGKLPSATTVIVRLTLVGALVVAAAYAGRESLVRPLLPALRVSLSLLDDEFQILSVDTTHEEPNDIIRIKANLRHPIYVGSAIAYPLGTHGQPRGWYQVNLVLAGVFEYCLLLIIVTFAWPATTWTDYLRRGAVLAPLVMLLLFIDLPFTAMAELRSFLHEDYQPYAFWPILAWSRFLMGGGGFAIAMVMAALTIRWSSRQHSNASRFGVPLAVGKPSV